MKAFISVDLEGMPHVVIPAHLQIKGTLYNEARRIATKVTLTTVEELNKNGFDEIVIADSHGPMVNILIEDLPEYVEIVRGFPRPLSMVSGAEGCNVALFLGYHAKHGTAKSTWDHTFSGNIIHKIELNAVAMSEFLLNAHLLGELGVPVMLVAGEARAIDDVHKFTPWAETLALKHSIARTAAKSFSLTRIEKELKEAVRRAVTNFKQNRIAPLDTKKPVKMQLTFIASHHADAAELLPDVIRTNGVNIEYTTDSVIKAYKILQLLELAAAGASSLLTKMQ